ncbi:potassium channel toxin alpha-KTx-like [Mytilus trossulus]|uniref:potassium channel toxin alpha-KTx-like n=1 Tax=Mytilus trossulus TaxID=6551 RepID=UPI003006E063
MKYAVIALIVVLGVLIVSESTTADDVSAFKTENYCNKNVANCPSNKADKNCNTCCRQAGCQRGDCGQKKCKCTKC